VKDREQDFVTFFNKALSITPKLHMLHLLPGIGKKLMWEILEERNKKPFAEFCRYIGPDKIDPSPGEDDPGADHGRTPGKRCEIPRLHLEMKAHHDQHFLIDPACDKPHRRS
jgi:hypothetical protein